MPELESSLLGLLRTWRRPLALFTALVFGGGQIPPLCAEERPPASVWGQETGEQGLLFPLPTVDEQGGLVLNPGTPDTLTVPAGELFPGAEGQSPAALEELYGDDAALHGATTAAQERRYWFSIIL
jgi:hypothetical protein